MTNILIVPEVTSEGKLRKISFELITAARVIGGDISVALVGSGVRGLAGELSSVGLSKLYVADSSDFNTSSSSSVAATIAAIADECGATVVLFGFTSFGRDISARLAARLDVGLVDDVTGFETGSDGGIVATKPLYAGKIISKCRLRNGVVQIFSVRPNTFPAAEAGQGTTAISDFPFASKPEGAKTTLLRKKETGDVDLREAQVIISGGRAVKGPDGFDPIRRIARRFGWAMGASRATVDAGWISHSYQVGQTGKTVNPKLYIACGISGAIQHLAGMQTSKVIVAINSDPEAPIFKMADFGIVGDIFTILPLLEAELAKILE